MCEVCHVLNIFCVKVRDGRDETGSFVGRYCGNRLPPVFRSSTSTVWLKMQSDISNHGSGFRAVWSVGEYFFQYMFMFK